MVSPKRTVARDYFNAPNRWVAVRSNIAEGETPVEGNGIYTYVNYYQGDTSVEARGRTITAPLMQLDVADQETLVKRAQITIDADMSPNTTFDLQTSPNPLHWHFDRLLVNDPAIGIGLNCLCTEWTLPLDGSDMTHKWSLL